jgi:prepilin-type processing-associated H-X9-DG protein
MWTTILMEEGAFSAPKSNHYDEIAQGPSLLRCPSGVNEPAMTDPGGYLSGGLDLPYTEEGIRAAQTHPAGAEGRPHECDSGGVEYWTHCWYGINGETWAVWDTPFSQLPNDSNDIILHRLDAFPRVASMAGVFDGFWLIDIFPGRINARHLNWSSANMMLLDGHAESVALEDLPDQLWRSGGSLEDVDEVFPIWRLSQID